MFVRLGFDPVLARLSSVFHAERAKRAESAPRGTASRGSYSVANCPSCASSSAAKVLFQSADCPDAEANQNGELCAGAAEPNDPLARYVIERSVR
jgi:hypothetical protein